MSQIAVSARFVSTLPAKNSTFSSKYYIRLCQETVYIVTPSHLLHILLMSSTTLIANELEEEEAQNRLIRTCLQNRKPSISRMFSEFVQKTHYLTNVEFKRAFKLSRPGFFYLLRFLNPFLYRNEKKARASTLGCITPAVRLGVTLRMLSGGS